MKEEKKSFYTLKSDPVFKNVFYRDTNLLRDFSKIKVTILDLKFDKIKTTT